MTTKTPIQKQIRTAMDRAFDNKQSPLSSKWKAIILDKLVDDKPHLLLFHYQHLVMVYNVHAKEVVYQWYEKPTDKRGLDSALAYLEEKKEREANTVRGVRSQLVYLFD